MTNILVVYDSFFGNTEKIAEAIGEGFGSSNNVMVLKVNNIKPDDIIGTELLIIGSPTRKFYPSPAIKEFLNHIPRKSLHGTKVAAFDTRVTEEEVEKIKILAFFVKIFGYAAKTISDKLEKKGGNLIFPPEGFYVGGMEGPLVDDEYERAVQWGKKIIDSLS